MASGDLVQVTADGLGVGRAGDRQHVIADDPDLDLNSHGLSQGSMADKLQPTCLPRRRPRHPTDFYALDMRPWCPQSSRVVAAGSGREPWRSPPWCLPDDQFV